MAFLRSFSTSRMGLFLLLTATLVGIETAITYTDAFIRHSVPMSMAVLFDLIFLPTVLFYWLIARPRHLANSQLVLVALLMLRIALFILPETAFPATKTWPTLLILAEGAVLVIAILRIRTITQTYRKLRAEVDAEAAFRGSLAVAFGERAAGAITGECLIVYYLLLGWRLRSDIPITAQPLTTHRQSGQIALTVGLLVIGLIESVGVHLLLTRWNPVVAFWITALSVYGMLFFVADIIATVKRPSYLTQKQLNLRLGIRWHAQIARSLLADSSLINEKPSNQAGKLNGAFLTAPNILLTFHEPVRIRGPYGIQKTVRQLSFFVDDRAGFTQALKEQQPD